MEETTKVKFGGNAKIKHHPIWILAAKNNRKRKVIIVRSPGDKTIFIGC